jgi:hypothetical protein
MVDWSQTFDTQMWNMANLNSLLTGFQASPLSVGAGSAADAPVYTHISLLNSEVIHNNLGGTGPDGGPQELRYGNVGHSGDRTFDLVITTDGDYKRKANNGKAGDFGRINFQACSRVDVTFSIVDAATGAPATIASFDITMFDLDDWKKHKNFEAITISGYDEMITQDDHYYTLTTEADGSITIAANHKSIPNPDDPMSLTDEQLKASVAFHFKMRSGFKATLGSICGKPQTTGGRNLMFSFDSALTPPDPGYQTGMQYMHQIQYAKTVDVGGLQSPMDCVQVDIDLNVVGMVECPAGRFMDGLYRTGSRYSDGNGPQQITQVSCCKPLELPDEWGDCHEQTVFRDASVMYQCEPAQNGRPTAVVGLHRGATHDTLDDIDKMKCCGFKQIDLIPDNPAGECQTIFHPR